MNVTEIAAKGAAAEITQLGRASKKLVEGIRVVRLKGTFFEMGRQHGRLLRDEIRQGPIPYYRTFVEKLFASADLVPGGTLALRLLQRTVGARIQKKLPAFALDTVKGIAEGAGLPYDEMLEGCTMPDSILWAASRLIEVQRTRPAMAHRLSLGLGCTSAIAWGAATRDGKLLHARNFDYHGVSSWPKTQTVFFCEPDEGQRYVSVAAAGVGLGGVTAMNEAGLTLTMHQHMFTAETRLGGTPVGVVGDIVMREAKNLDDAERILRAHAPIACWTYLITDGRAKEVLCWEENPLRKAPRRIGGDRGDASTFGYANVYLDRELGDTERDLYPSYWRHNHGRHTRANALLDARAGSLDPAAMGDILADVGGDTCRIHESIAMVLTVGSVVFRPEDGALWVGSGEAPTSHGSFVPFSLASSDHAPELGSFRAEVPEGDRLAFEHFRRAYVAYVDERDTLVARREVGHACELAPRQPVYHALAGILALATNDAQVADAKLTRAIELGHPTEARVASFHLWRGRARDLLGRRDEALRDYRRVLGLRSDLTVGKAAERGLSRPFTASAATRIRVEMSLADVVEP